MKAMKKLLEANTASGRRRVSEVFRDFCELSALAIRNRVDPHGADQREARYLEIVGGYARPEVDRFPELLALLAVELSESPRDVLGDLYMSLELGNERLGQFFTPWSVSQLMAELTVDGAVEKLDDHEFIRVHEPASGSGGMTLAFVEALRARGVDCRRSVHISARDLDITAVHMTYLQLALTNTPALIAHGNTLTLEEFDVWPTPAHVVDGWDARLRNMAAAATTVSAPGG